MQTTKKVILKRSNGNSSKAKEFNFSPEYNASVVEDHFENYRKKAWREYQNFDFPNQRIEAWRRTSLDKLKPENFSLAGSQMPPQSFIPEDMLEEYQNTKTSSGYLIINQSQTGRYLDPELENDGVVFDDIQSVQKKYPQLLKKITGKLVKAEEGKFAALAAAMADNGVLLYVPKNVHINRPLQSLYWAPANKSASFCHILVFLEEGASAKYIHEVSSPEQKEQSFFAGITEIYINKSASLEFNEIQTLGKTYWNFSHERAQIERDAHLDWVYSATGSWRSKNFLDIDLAGTGAEARMSGFYFTDNDQHIDLDTQQNHLKPHTTSDLLFKGATQDTSRAVWQGMIYVAPGADKTDGYQTNRNMLLSDDSRIDTIPGLEIKANDVRCSHGATIGKIEDEQIFYLLSRGIPQKEAVQLIVEGFFNPIIDRIQNEDIRTKIGDLIKEKI